VFFLFADHFSAFLEDSKGHGKQFLVSKVGISASLKQGDNAEAFFAAWKASLSKPCCDFPAIQQLVYAAYEASCVLEKLPKPKTSVLGEVLWRHEPEWSICFDTDCDKIYLASRVSEEQLNEIEYLLEKVKKIKEKAVNFETTSIPMGDICETGNMDYCAAVEKVKAYIHAGDVFQVNIARFWQTKYEKHDLLQLFKALRKVNPAPFACFVETDHLSIISASPERLFSLSADGFVETRPIAGTRRRSEGDTDHQLRDELLLSDKERAEHIMLVDLERNDLGRVCQAGTVEVNEHMVIEKYATVQHIVSNVRGKLDAQYDVVDVFKAMFPGGTITGCPKVRCMEVIHELEHQARGPYTGSVGYIAYDGSADMNILIRTFWHESGMLHWAAGAGIVDDSQPEHERIETEHKVAGLLLGLHELHGK